jgi:hypothetical protein
VGCGGECGCRWRCVGGVHALTCLQRPSSGRYSGLRLGDAGLCKRRVADRRRVRRRVLCDLAARQLVLHAVWHLVFEGRGGGAARGRGCTSRTPAPTSSARRTSPRGLFCSASVTPQCPLQRELSAGGGATGDVWRRLVLLVRRVGLVRQDDHCGVRTPPPPPLVLGLSRNWSDSLIAFSSFLTCSLQI